MSDQLWFCKKCQSNNGEDCGPFNENELEFFHKNAWSLSFIDLISEDDIND